MVRRGVTTVAAAGNHSMDAATFAPAAYPEVIAVSAMADFDGQPGGLARSRTVVCVPRRQLDDHFAFFSNYGAPVDIAAPGVCVTSTFPGSQYAFSTAPASQRRSWPERPRCTSRRIRMPRRLRCVKRWSREPNRDRSSATRTPFPRACSTSAASERPRAGLRI